MDQIKSITTALEGQLAMCAASLDVELQERAAELAGLLGLVRKGLDAPRPKRPDVEQFGGDSLDPYDPTRKNDGDRQDTDAGGFADSSPSLPPTSLQLLSALFSSHELNPVNPKAQGMVAVPEGLDLDASIVPRASIPRVADLDISDDADDIDPFGRRRGGLSKQDEERALVGSEKKKKTKVATSGKQGKSARRQRAAEEADDPDLLEKVI